MSDTTPTARPPGMWLDDPLRAAGVAAAVALVVFLPSLFNGFAYDDLHILVDHEALHTLGGTLKALTRPYWPGVEGRAFGLWRPLTTLALGAQWVLFGGAPWGFHLVNLLLHALCAALVVYVGARLLPARVAALAGLVFAVHPVHVEAVANVVGFSELAATACMLAAVALILGVRDDGERCPRLGAGRMAALLWLYLAACLIKENAIVLPALLVVSEAIRFRWTPADLGGIAHRRGFFLIMATAVALAVLGGRLVVLGSVAAPMPPLGAGFLLEIPRIHTLGEIWFQYARLLTIPMWLSPDYAPPVVRVTTVWTARGLLGIASVIALLCAGWVAERRGHTRTARALPGGLAWFVVAALPVSNVVFVSGVLVAERTLYGPSVGIAWMLGAGLVWLLRRRRLVGLITAAALALLWTARTVTYEPVWHDRTSAFEAMVRVVPASARSLWVTADALLDAGRPREAVRRYARALAFLGREVPFLTQSARKLHEAGESRVARILAERAFSEDPHNPAAPQLLATIAANEGDGATTVRWARATLRAAPDDAVGWHLLSWGLAQEGEWAAARDAREALLERSGRDAWQQWFWLTELRARAGDPAGARAAADSARLRAPGAAAVQQIDSLLAAVTGAGGPL